MKKFESVSSLFSVLIRPQQIMLRVRKDKKGFGIFFILMLLEWAFRYPETLGAGVVRLFSFPQIALINLWYSAMNSILPPALFVFVAGLMLHYMVRNSKAPRLDPWTGASIITYAWFPHTLIMAIFVLVAAWLKDFLPEQHELLAYFQFQTFLPSSTMMGAWIFQTVLFFAPTLYLMRHGLRAIFLVDSSTNSLTNNTDDSSAQETQAPKNPTLIPILGISILFMALASNTLYVRQNWDRIRPPLLGDAFDLGSLGDLTISRTQKQNDNKNKNKKQNFQNKVLLLDFWATWCEPCVRSIPTLIRLHREFADQAFQLVSINNEGAQQQEQVRAFIRTYQIPFDVYFDLESPSLSEQLRITTLPTFILIGADGALRSIHIGEASYDDLHKHIEALLPHSETHDILQQ